MPTTPRLSPLCYDFFCTPERNADSCGSGQDRRGTTRGAAAAAATRPRTSASTPPTWPCCGSCSPQGCSRPPLCSRSKFPSAAAIAMAMMTAYRDRRKAGRRRRAQVNVRNRKNMPEKINNGSQSAALKQCLN